MLKLKIIWAVENWLCSVDGGRLELAGRILYEKTICLTESSAAGEKNMDFYANTTGFPSQNSTELHEN